jgi:4-hydroxy-tetrahydrodipicolinate reductase
MRAKYRNAFPRVARSGILAVVMPSTTDIAILGAAGRMGTRLIALAHQTAGLKIAAAIEREGHPLLGRDAGEVAGIGAVGLPVTTDLSGRPKVLLDFSASVSTRHWLDVCRKRKIAMLIGTTGLSEDDHRAIDAAAADIAVLQAPNMSLGVNLLIKLCADAARRLGDAYDIEIVEAHHRYKKDAPSGTAMAIAQGMLDATGKGREALVYDRHGDDCVRKPGEIGMHALRVGDEVGRHTACFATMGERLELTHVATSRDTFVRGALIAAQWLAGKRHGRYTIADVLGLA